MNWIRRCAATALTLWLHGALAGAQPPPPPARQPPAPEFIGLPRFDVSGSIGWFNQRTGNAGCCNWYNQSLWGDATGGYYWTEHVKTEIGIAASSEGRAYSTSETVQADGRVYQSWGDTRISTRRLTLAQVYQFRHNAWAHPYVGAGLNVVRERRLEERHLVPLGPYDRFPPAPERVERVATRDNVLRGMAFGGVKAYVTQRVFVKVDAQVGFRSRVDEVTLRCGAGVDF